jgi:hypothetical protein
MSAFLCSHEHFKILAMFAVTDGRYGLRVDPRHLPDAAVRGLNNESPATIATHYANILYRENFRSIKHRYPSSTVEASEIRVTDKDISNNKGLDAVSLLKQCDCLIYQSCETDDYYETLAYKLVGMIKDAAIKLLPGYESAPWGI